MIDYTTDDGRKFSVSYKELKSHYKEICRYSQAKFLQSLPEIIHTACIICWFKEVPSSRCLRDDGIIHELAHMMHIGGSDYEVKQVMKLFRYTCKLA